MPLEDFNNHPPDRLTVDLARLFAHASPVPPSVDVAILRSLHGRAATIRRLRHLVRWGGLVAAVAAVLMVALRVHTPAAPRYAPGASVTILDAFSLARQLKAGSKVDRTWDVNHDGRVDQQDVDQLAGQAVRLAGTR